MGRIRRHVTFANVASAIALFVALGGGTAVALSGTNTVFTDDIANDTQPASGGNPAGGLVAADLRPGSVGTSEVANGSLDLPDLNATSRPHKLEFAVPAGTVKTPISTIGHLQVSGRCSLAPELFIYLKNLSGSTGTQNALIAVDPSTATTPVNVYTSGEFVGAGVEVTLDASDGPGDAGLAGGDFQRVEGQLVFQTPGRVTTIDFHAFTFGPTNPHCEFFGTAVTSNLA